MHQIRFSPFFKKLLRGKHTSDADKCVNSSLTMDDIPRRKSFLGIKTKLEFVAAGGGAKLHEYIDRRHQQLGPVFREKLGGYTELVFVNDPYLIRTLLLNLEGKYPAHILPEPWMLYEKLYGSQRGLFFMNGEEWLNNRRITNKHLLKEGSERWLEGPIKAAVSKFIQRWKNATESASFVPDLESELYRFSIDVIVAVMLGNNTTINYDQHYEILLSKFSESVKKIFQTTTKLYGWPLNLCHKLNLKVWRDFKDCVDTSLFLAHKIVQEILNVRQDTNGLVNILSKENISDEDIKKIIGDFVIAAGDTTTYTTLWSLFLLSKYEDIKSQASAASPTFMNYVIKESMRLYPVAPFLTRILPKDCVLGPYRLNAGTPVIASIYTSGRDETNFSKADIFLPYRWDRNNDQKKQLTNHVTLASLPFALGARSCIGKKLAMLQMTELLNQIVENFDFQCLNKDEVKVNMSQVLVPSTDIKLAFSLKKSERKGAEDEYNL